MLYWTKEKPTEPGWYWRRNASTKSHAKMVHIQYDFTGKVLCVEKLIGLLPLKEDDTREWAGPIGKPREKPE